ncbi:MAG: dTDP-glucose 4,6-dehydratase [Leptospiraceae bacterium]|nr:dTDP-glucose 4,6-dehydratase [Leptospiraceae bacterium]MCK6382219.1 dTDP-glucose 4,6-dehydratase [Leptospiraceae bacterium]NUM42230.1 dTDP-glucose 4,6-dehydratase [Leptospiraceae bacterium]
MERILKNILVTGGAGFIGANFLHYLAKIGFKGRVVNLDSLTYAGDLDNIKGIENKINYRFVKGDIRDSNLLQTIFEEEKFDTVVHFAAESHVDNSIKGPKIFLETNVIGTYELLATAKNFWEKNQNISSGVLFHHISTDEVYGSLGETGYFTEDTPYDPSSPYSASKASSDHFVMAYHRTYNLPVTISNCSNNYGPFQNKEKLIPLMITNAISGNKLPVYGDGKNIRDWLYVEDHCDAIWAILQKGETGRTYNIGGNNEWKNIDIVKYICKVLGNLTENPVQYYENLISYVNDRPGHDRRYAIDSSRIQKEINWFPKETFETGIEKTVRFYLKNIN